MNLTTPTLVAGALLAMLAGPALATTDLAEEREIFVEQGFKNAGAGTTKSETKAALKTSGKRERTEKGRTAPLAAINQDFWIFEAFTNVVFDQDRDGFFTRLELDFDADTVFVSADVYAVVYLSLEGGPWNEVTATETFTILGAGDGDEYFVDIDLLSGYPAGSYDVLIELYDTFDNLLVAEFGPNDSLALFDLPLEDQVRDEVIIVDAPVVAVRGGGGALGIWMLLLMIGAGTQVARRRGLID